MLQLSKEDQIIVNAFTSSDGAQALALMKKEYYDVIADPGLPEHIAVFVNGQRSVIHNILKTLENAEGA